MEEPDTISRRGALVAGMVAVLVLALTAPAVALPLFQTNGAGGPGGTVEIHEAPERLPEPAAGPTVCILHLQVFRFDPGQVIRWQIQEWPLTGPGEVVLHGELQTDERGGSRTADLTLPIGWTDGSGRVSGRGSVRMPPTMSRGRDASDVRSARRGGALVPGLGRGRGVSA